MSKPDDIPQDIAAMAEALVDELHADPDVQFQGILAGPTFERRIAETLTDEREHCASLVEEYCAQMNLKGRDKMLLTIVARAIRRGRNWTRQEQVGFLAAFLAGEADVSATHKTSGEA